MVNTFLFLHDLFLESLFNLCEVAGFWLNLPKCTKNVNDPSSTTCAYNLEKTKSDWLRKKEENVNDLL